MFLSFYIFYKINIMLIYKVHLLYFCFLTEHDQITATNRPLNIQQKTSPTESVSSAASLMDKNHVTRMLHKELSSLFSVPKSSQSCVDASRGPLSPAEQLMHRNSSKCLSENEDITSEHTPIIDKSRPLQDISDDCRFSDSKVSFLHKKRALQVSLTTAMSQASHINGAEPICFKSVSLSDTEGIYDDTRNVVLPKHLISKGWKMTDVIGNWLI